MLNSKVLGVIACAFIALIIGLATPFEGLPPQGHLILATVIVTLGFWIFRPGGLPFMAGGTILLAGGLIFGLKYDVVAAGFVSPAVWVLIPALYFGFVLQKTGLGKRIAYLVLKSFEPSWASMAVSWLIIGIALSALTPSITVRIAIVMPIAVSVVEACKQSPGSKGSAFITIIAWAMCLFPGTGWLTGSLTGPIMLGFLPAELKPMATFDAWFQILALPWLIVTVVFVILIYITMRPKEAIGIPRDTFRAQYSALGPITKNEIIAICVLVGSLVMFTTEKIHHIPTAAVALAALALLIIFKIITVPEISTGVNWDVILFFGVAISLSPIFVNAKVSAWIGPILQPNVLALAGSPLVFLLVTTFGIMLIRFIDVPWGFSTIALTIPVLIPVFNQFGIHPLVASMAYIVGINFFLLSYQQPFALIAEGMMQGKGWAPSHVTLAGASYIAAVVVALLISLPYWRMIGVIK
jgi:anion transporter